MGEIYSLTELQGILGVQRLDKQRKKEREREKKKKRKHKETWARNRACESLWGQKRPDIKRIFSRHFRGEIARKYAKTIGKSIPKTHGPKKKQKQKFAPENLSHKPNLRRRELCQKTAKDKNQTTKNKKKTDSISPLKKRGESKQTIA